ncbi:TPA: MFS transporter [Yersinia enterocolitica]|nr:MFS transporter [Yersinia enterocolitica]
MRIFSSGLAQDATTISLMKLLHAVELPILLIAMFKYIAANCDPRLSGKYTMAAGILGATALSSPDTDHQSHQEYSWG